MTENMSERFSIRESLGKCFWAAVKLAAGFTVFTIVLRVVVDRTFLWDSSYLSVVYFLFWLVCFFPIMLLLRFLDHRELARSDKEKEVVNDE